MNKLAELGWIGWYALAVFFGPVVWGVVWALLDSRRARRERKR
ncbi:hypothetical protein [Amycolatopsis anabasis]|nr:hypothetical protein [Amycolatopsis anabasis]